LGGFIGKCDFSSDLNLIRQGLPFECMDTAIHKLLTRDGVVDAAFEPALDSDQLRELAVIACLPNSSAELRARLHEAASRWGCCVDFNGAQLKQSAH
jgi:hypothetical protein